MLVEISDQERHIIGSHLCLPTYSKREEAEVSCNLLIKLGYDAALETIPHKDFETEKISCDYIIYVPEFDPSTREE